MAHLELTNLAKRYDGAPVVRDFTLTVERGQFVSLLGPSGCGKTTTLRMVAGFVMPSAGAIRLAGRAIDRDPPHKRNIGMVFQNYALFPHLTVAANVAFGLKMRHIDRAEQDARVAEALALVGLSPYAERYPAQLSGGQQQRVAIARALVIRPDVLLLDEPLSNLDAGLRAEMRSEIRRLQQQLGITTLFVTHDQEEALSMSDRVAVMAQGELVEDAPPRELSERPRRVFTASFLGARTVLGGHVEGEGGARRFVTESGLSARLPQDAPVGANHLVLRAARLTLARQAPESGVFATPGRVSERAYVGDTVEFRIQAGAAAIRVIRPSSEDLPDAGDEVVVTGGADAVAFLFEPREREGVKP
jgi:putative spermidine/putrescine transport system ATP-binding protein